MDPLCMLDEDHLSLQVAHTSDPDCRRSEAIVRAFHKSDVDVTEKETTLYDWIRTDLLDGFDWAESPEFLCVRIWGRPVIVTANQVRIYTEYQDT